MDKTEKDTPVIYGLEFQSRALSAQTAELYAIRFLVGTQSLKFPNNQVHLVELDEETGNLKTQIFQHSIGEIWSIQASPSEPDKFTTCYNTLMADGTCQMKGALWQIPAAQDTNEPVPLQKLADIDTTPYGSDLRNLDYHPVDNKKIASVVDNNFVLWDISFKPQAVTVGTLKGKGQPRFTSGKWSPHNSLNEFVTLNENHVRGWDFRKPEEPVWAIMSAHSQIIRDLDFNVNKQYVLATCGDDGYVKFWDIRNPGEPIMARMEHSHWVWCVRINHFHDQLVLTSSSDSRVVLSSVASISSEPIARSADAARDEDALDEEFARERLEDGALAKFEEHEDSVYAVEWSSADPWTFASLSFDGRLVINRVPNKYKRKIQL